MLLFFKTISALFLPCLGLVPTESQDLQVELSPHVLFTAKIPSLTPFFIQQWVAVFHREETKNALRVFLGYISVCAS